MTSPNVAGVNPGPNSSVMTQVDALMVDPAGNTGSPINAANLTGSLANATIPAGNVTVGGLVVNSAAAAAANTTAIQAALTAGGQVSITAPGVFYINATLVYGSNTTLTLGANTTVRLASQSNCSMLMSSSLIAFINGGTTLNTGASVTLTQGTACAVNVAWTGHGLVAGQGVWIAGATDATVSAYNGVFRVGTVVDANNFTIFTPVFSTTAPAGTTIAQVAVQNFNLAGGTWDANYLNQTIGVSSYNNISIFFSGVIDCTANTVSSINATKFSYQIHAATYFRGTNLKSTNVASDTLKIYGPSVAVLIDGLAGISHDDFVSIQPYELSPYNWAQFSAPGYCHDITIRNIQANSFSNASVVHLYPCDQHAMDLIHIEGATGNAPTTGSAVVCNYPAGLSYGYIGRVVLKNIQIVTDTNNTPPFAFYDCNIDELTFEDCSFIPGNTAQSANNDFLTLGPACTINTLVLNRVKSNGWPSTAGNITFVYINGAALTRVVLRDMVIKGATGTMNLLSFGSTNNTVREILFDGGVFDASVYALVGFATALASGTPNVTFRNIDTIGYPQRGVNFSALVNAHVRFECSSLVFLTAAICTSVSNTVKVFSSGDCEWNGISPISISAGSPVITLNGWDIAYDAGLLATTKGQYFTHASAVAGRNAANQQGPCIGVDGTHFYALGTGAAGVNTLIV